MRRHYDAASVVGVRAGAVKPATGRPGPPGRLAQRSDRRAGRPQSLRRAIAGPAARAGLSRLAGGARGYRSVVHEPSPRTESGRTGPEWRARRRADARPHPRRTRRLLVVVLDPNADVAALRRVVARRDEPVAVRVVAPAHVGPLEWYATDEDRAREEAERQASQVGAAVADQAAETETEAGDLDLGLAVQDALQTFAADEIVLVGAPGDDTTAES